MAYVIKHNDPSPGYVSWSNMNMAYNGTTYAIANGNSNMIFIYWLLSSPYVMQTSNTFPTLAHTDVVVILNKSGTALLVPGSTILDGSLIVPGTILADALSANSVTSAKILAGSIQSTHISTGAVVADSIAAGAIGAAAIAAGAVISDHILADNVLASHIAAGNIQTAHLAAGAIDTNQLAAEAVTAAKIEALTITAAQIAADAITAAKIKAGEITTNHIHVDGLDANVIKAGYLAAARIEAGSMTVDKLHVLARNRVNNWTIDNSTTGWSTSGTGTAVIVDNTLKNARVLQLQTSGDLMFLSSKFKVDPTQTYKVTMSVYCSAAAGTRYFGLYCYNRAGTLIAVTPFTVATRVWETATSNPYFWTAAGSLGTSWRDMEAYILGCNVTDAAGVPAGLNVTTHFRLPSDAYEVIIRVLNYYNSGTLTDAFWYSPSVEAVDAGKLHASSVLAGTVGGARVTLGASSGAPYVHLYDSGNYLRVSLLQDRLAFEFEGKTAGHIQAITPIGVLSTLTVTASSYLRLQTSSWNIYLSDGNDPGIQLNANVQVGGWMYVQGGSGRGVEPINDNAIDLGHSSAGWRHVYLNRATIFDGRFYPRSTSTRNAGMYGVYDSTKIGHVWSMGTAYLIPDTGANFGNLYGIAYKHTNNTTGGTMAGAHQIVFCNNGASNVAIGLGGNIWCTGEIYVKSNADGSPGAAVYATLLEHHATLSLKANKADETHTGVHIFNPGSDGGYTIYVDKSGVYNTYSRPTIRPSADTYGFVGTSGRRFYEMYASGGFLTSSEERLKRDIGTSDLSNCYSMVKGLKFHNYRFKTDVEARGEKATEYIGIIADEAPDIVCDEVKKNINLYPYISLIGAAVQDIQARLEMLEQKK